MATFKPLEIKFGGATYSTFMGKAGLFYWHARTLNGRIVLDSAQGYTRHSTVKQAMRREIERLRPETPYEDGQ